MTHAYHMRTPSRLNPEINGTGRAYELLDGSQSRRVNTEELNKLLKAGKAKDAGVCYVCCVCARYILEWDEKESATMCEMQRLCPRCAKEKRANNAKVASRNVVQMKGGSVSHTNKSARPVQRNDAVFLGGAGQ